MITSDLTSPEMVLLLARRRAGGWMPADYREAHGQRIVQEASDDLRAIAAALESQRFQPTSEEER